MKMRSTTTLLAALAAAALWTTPVMAQHDHGGAKAQPRHDDGHVHGEVAKAKTFAEAARRIADEVKAIEAALKGGSVAGVSERAHAVNALAKNLGALSLAKDSGIPREKVKQANLAGKELAEAADALHEIADTGDVAKSTAAFAAVKAAAAKIEAVAPAAAAPQTYTIEVKPVGDVIAVGKPTTFVFTIKDPAGQPVKKVETVHEKPLHVLMVSKDLSWFAHEHPTLQPDGTFTFAYTFPQAGEFYLYNDFTPSGGASVGQQVVMVPVTVAGTAPAAKPLVIDADKAKTIDGYTVSLDPAGGAGGGPVKAGGSTRLAYTIAKDGKPVTTLQPYLGAMGHLVIISEDRTQFVHAHPHESGAGQEAGGKGAMGGPRVDFVAQFTVPGTYKVWAQFNVGTAAKEEIITVPFTFNVAPGDSKSAAPHEHKHGAMPVNGVCPITREVADASFTRDFKGQVVGFHDAASATTWDGLKDEERMSKFVAALAAAVPAGHDDGMPDGLADAEARTLYLTPGGKYTEADIKANGSVTAGAKFKGVMSKHDFKPKVGDAICPITLTKVNPKFTWIIGGKTYQFCCPPCIDEFVLLAKESPTEIKDPSFYVKK
jgi:hypothetical protein